MRFCKLRRALRVRATGRKVCREAGYRGACLALSSLQRHELPEKRGPWLCFVLSCTVSTTLPRKYWLTNLPAE